MLPKNAPETIRLLAGIPALYLFRRIGWPRRLPWNLTLSVTSRCNSRCKTCNIHEKRSAELSLKEWQETFRTYGRNLFWATVSGGEPFLREDLAEIVCSLYDCCRPAVITIPTNGLLDEHIPRVAAAVAAYCSNTHLVINLSIDDIEERHDALRGVPGAYARTVKTFRALKALNLPNLSIGIHTVISKFNVARIQEIYRHLQDFHADSYVAEIAEEREELATMGCDITPGISDYAEAASFLLRQLKGNHARRAGTITRALRIEYYALTQKILAQQRQIIPCYAGFASAQIAPDGEVWMCCVKAESIGNLRTAAYDMRTVWFSERAQALRRRIKKGDCYCPLANAAYTSMLHHPRTLLRLARNYLSLNRNV